MQVQGCREGCLLLMEMSKEGEGMGQGSNFLAQGIN